MDPRTERALQRATDVAEQVIYRDSRRWAAEIVEAFLDELCEGSRYHVYNTFIVKRELGEQELGRPRMR